MKKVIAVMSAKGGVGKSTVSANLGRQAARLGKETLILELDAGMRGLDIMLGIKDVVYDFDDILFGRYSLKQAIVQSEKIDRLSLIPAPVSFQRHPTIKELQVLCEVFLKKYENIILDVTAGYSLANAVAQIADEILVVLTPDPICIRDTAVFGNYLRQRIAEQDKLFIIVNKINKQGYINGLYKDIDKIIDDTGLRLKGVIPSNNELMILSAKGQEMDKNSQISDIFRAIAKRVNEESAPLILKELK